MDRASGAHQDTQEYIKKSTRNIIIFTFNLRLNSFPVQRCRPALFTSEKKPPEVSGAERSAERSTKKLIVRASGAHQDTQEYTWNSTRNIIIFTFNLRLNAFPVQRCRPELFRSKKKKPQEVSGAERSAERSTKKLMVRASGAHQDTHEYTWNSTRKIIIFNFNLRLNSFPVQRCRPALFKSEKKTSEVSGTEQSAERSTKKLMVRASGAHQDTQEYIWNSTRKITIFTFNLCIGNEFKRRFCPALFKSEKKPPEVSGAERSAERSTKKLMDIKIFYCYGQSQYAALMTQDSIRTTPVKSRKRCKNGLESSTSTKKKTFPHCN
ncbi:hypothetical protein CDAR_120331 [Caerostris darwini]|uniref:Uncharacterized protein n=1 Tax=Caerostris darwini TaxID=1538125 RepID=A0AAV4VES7_9ARAC|nr:hypothetical protein CDAR_120331 [Caerostris darwini]